MNRRTRESVGQWLPFRSSPVIRIVLLTVTLPNTTHPRIRFSVRALLLAVTGFAFILGFFASLPVMVPRWRDLITRIELARGVPVHDGLHRGFQFEFNDWPQPTSSTYGFAIVITFCFYMTKHLVLRYLHALDLRVFAYVCLVTLVLPHIYLNWTDWSAVNVYFLGHLIFMPVAVLAVPTISFAYDASRTEQPTAKFYLARSLIELLLVTPVWTFLWGIMILLSGLAWI